MHDQPIVDPPRVEPAQSMTPLGSTVSTDRPCASCGFNLFGQILQREPVYKLVVARCPECGTIASLQEYPAMTGWVNRWKLLLASVWIVILLGVLVGNFGAATGLNYALVDVASENYADLLGIRYDEFTGGKANPNRYSGRWTNVDLVWARDNAPRILDEMGGVLHGTNRAFLWGWTGTAVVMFLFGVFWSTTLLGARRRTALLIPGLAIVAAGSLVIVNNAVSDWLRGSTPLWAGSIAKHVYIPYTVPMNMALMLIAAGVGVFAGRPLVRFVVQMMLPPRLRTPLGVLWTRDGLKPPKARSV
ncbi:MAG: hypothetical protein KC996_05590 [Phycisphaerales bacterium]|nr:hypothetical protein [Phycisphaerales bacterium]